MSKNMNREKIVNGLSTYLRSLSRKRSNNVISADDAHTFLDRQGWSRKPAQRLSVINAVLREPMFESVGSMPSSREAARGRAITQWEVAGN
jgi:hypothetical protein